LAAYSHSKQIKEQQRLIRIRTHIRPRTRARTRVR